MRPPPVAMASRGAMLLRPCRWLGCSIGPASRRAVSGHGWGFPVAAAGGSFGGGGSDGAPLASHQPRPNADPSPPSSSSPPPPLAPGLYVVATPIGNMGDLSPRAAAVLTSADCVLCEDTRHSGPLLARAAALTAALSGSGGPGPPRPPLLSLHAHNEAARTDTVLARLGAGEAVALISDAGTPLLSDPGSGLVAAAAGAGHAITPVPGPCAAVAAVSAAGLDAGDFLFLGFLSARPGARRAALCRVRAVPAALVCYVPARSLAAFLEDAAGALGPGRRVAVGREITKRHEEWWRGALGEGAAAFRDRDAGGVRGEVTVVVERPARAAAAAAAAGEGGEEGGAVGGGGSGAGAVDAEAALASLLADGVPPSAAAKALARALGVGRAGLYEAAVRWKEEGRGGGSGGGGGG